GAVTDPTGASIPGVTVTATNEATLKTGAARTNDNGHYQFTQLAPGNYCVRFVRQGFRTETKASITVTPGARQLDISFAVGTGGGVEVSPQFPPLTQLTGEIVGVVNDSAGSAIAGAEIQAIKNSNTATYKTITDCSGFYKISDLAEGTYEVHFARMQFQSQT